MKKITLLVALWFSITAFSATTYLVQLGTTGATTWRSAGVGETLVDLTVQSKSLTAWLTAATFTNGDAVWLAAGTYDVTSSYAFPTAGLSIYGGFAGTETTLAGRAKGTEAWTFTNSSIISGNLATTIFTPGGARVGTILDGLSITRGGSAGSCAIVLRDGMTMQNCYLYGNVSTGNGGAVILNGGGNILNSYFYNNKGNSGGAVHVGTTAGVTSNITNCLFESNQAAGGANNLGGALRSQAVGVVNINNCIIKNNDATGNGSAVHIQIAAATNYTYLTNCLIYGNTTKGALYLLGGTLYNCTVVNNTIGGAYMASATVPAKIYNSVFWGTDAAGLISSVGSNSGAVIQNSAYTSLQTANYTGTPSNCITLPITNTVDPLAPYFVDPATNNWEITYQSSLLNSGSGSISGVPTKDLINASRPRGAAYDMGAYELPYYNTTVTFNANGAVNSYTSPATDSIPKGTPKTFTITPNSGYKITSVLYNDVDVKGDMAGAVYTAPALTANATLVVQFDLATALNNKTQNDFQCISVNKSIELNGVTVGDEINVFNVAGAKVRSLKSTASTASIALPQGIYMVKVANQVKKVVVR